VEVGRYVTSAAVFEALECDADLIILSHGSQEGLVLADGVLSSDMLKSRLASSNCPTVALVACKAGHGFSLPWSSAAPLPTALLQRGVGAVIAARWDLPELSAAIFAERWCHARSVGRPPVHAYREAVDFIRSITLMELLTWNDEKVAACLRRPEDEIALWFAAAAGRELASVGDGSANGSEEATLPIVERAFTQLRNSFRQLVGRAGPDLIPLSLVKDHLDYLTKLTMKLDPLANWPLDRPAFTAPIHWAGPCLFGLPA
jgi:hypothetical protein